MPQFSAEVKKMEKRGETTPPVYLEYHHTLLFLDLLICILVLLEHI